MTRLRLRWLLLPLFACLLLVPHACATYRETREIPFVPERVAAYDATDYAAMLVDLPLRFDSDRWHIDLKEPGATQAPPVREAHLLRDARDPSRDVLLVVQADQSVFSLSPRDFTLNWRGILQERTFFDPVLTNESVFFMSEAGEYQKFSRYDGTLTGRSHFGVGFRPSTQPAANDTHVIVPVSGLNAVHGRPDDRRAIATGRARVWQFPNDSKSTTQAKFAMVKHPPIADLESIYFVSTNNYLYGVAAQTGEFRFMVDLGRDGTVRTPPILKNNVIYVGTDLQLFAISRSGSVLWTLTTDGPVEGPIFAMDESVYYRTLKATITETTADSRDKKRSVGWTLDKDTFELHLEPGSFEAVHFTTKAPPIHDSASDSPTALVKDEQGNIVYDTPVIRGPRAVDWKLPNLEQQVLLKTGKYLFVLYSEWEIPYSSTQQRELKEQKKVIKPDELKVVTRKILQVLDIATGKPVEHAGQKLEYDVSKFDFILGSMAESDRAIYFITRNGHIFKGFATE